MMMMIGNEFYYVTHMQYLTFASCWAHLLIRAPSMINYNWDMNPNKPFSP